MQTHFKDSDFVERTIDRYNNDMKLLALLNGTKDHVNGFKRDTCFKGLKYFHIVDGFPLDIMHDWLEGVLVYAFGDLMNYLVSSKLLSFEKFQTDLNNFTYSRLDAKNKVPTNLFTTHALATNKGFHLSATHFWTLIRIFPIMHGELLCEDIYYKNFLKAIELFFLLNSSAFTVSQLDEIEEKTEIYLMEYKNLYPKKEITAKFHHLIHYRRAIELFGPILEASTMRFESKHSQLKREDHAIHNHINQTKSISYKHQDMQLFHLSSPNYFTQNVLGPLEQLELCNKTIINHLVQNRGELSYHKHVVFNHIKYFLGDMICYDSDHNILFGQIKHLITNQKKLIFFSK